MGRSNAGGVRVHPRIPLITGITATDQSLTAASCLLRGLGVRRVQLLPQNPLWRDKGARLGIPVRYDRTGWRSPAEIPGARAHFTGFEIVA